LKEARASLREMRSPLRSSLKVNIGSCRNAFS
jgi:hypothetical protein